MLPTSGQIIVVFFATVSRMGLLPETFLESFEASAIAEGDIRALLQLRGKPVVDTMRPASGLLGRAGRGTFHA